jgi:L-fuconate dehydratase
LSDLKITNARVIDLRFPTSREHIGSDAVNVDPDYSAAYCILETNHGLHGYGLTFTLGRGTELCVEALRYLSRFAVGRNLSSITDDLGAFYRQLTSDSQFRWLGPEKGVIHLATGALINAVWDLYARVEGKPLWKLLADMDAEDIVRATSGGWFGFSDEKILRLADEALAQGWTHFKLKVGGEAQDDLRRARLVRSKIGPHNKLMMDANQKWDVEEAIERTRMLAEVDPWWMEEPTSPDDILGHARIRREVPQVRIATGEHCHNRVMFKQLLQANAIDVCQIDSCRLAGVNENLAVILMAAKFDVPVCPHAGGVGLCEYVQHLSAFDYLRASTTLENRVTEFVDHLHEHFVDPVRISNAHYMLPEKPGYSAEIYPETLRDYSYPDGRVWRDA